MRRQRKRKRGSEITEPLSRQPLFARAPLLVSGPVPSMRFGQEILNGLPGQRPRIEHTDPRLLRIDRVGDDPVEDGVIDRRSLIGRDPVECLTAHPGVDPEYSFAAKVGALVETRIVVDHDGRVGRRFDGSVTPSGS